MGLDDVAKDEALKVGNVKSNISAESISQSEEWWQTLAIHYSDMVYYSADALSESEVKKLIELLDNVIQDDIHGVNVGDNEKRSARRAREHLVEELEGR